MRQLLHLFFCVMPGKQESALPGKQVFVLCCYYRSKSTCSKKNINRGFYFY